MNWTDAFPKKLIAAVVASVLAYLAFKGGMDTPTVGVIISPLVSFILGQGLADVGKSAAIIKTRRS
jgi:hypothetical protein